VVPQFTFRSFRLRRIHEWTERNMNIVKDVCTVVPVVLVIAAAVVGIATAMSLASWSVL
jgi:hypothetical protein